MKERAWYQDGEVMFWVCVVTAVLAYYGHREWKNAEIRALPTVVPEVTGRLHQPLLGAPTLEIDVWHQYPAALKNIMLFVNVNEDPALSQETWIRREHSFENWSPNEDQKVSFSFPLKNYDPEREIQVAIVLGGKSIKPYTFRTAWLGDTWKKLKHGKL